MREQLLLYRQRLLERFAEVGENIAQAAAGMSPDKWHVAAADGETPHLILARLREFEAHKYSVRLRRILDEEVPRLPLFDDKQWIKDHYDPGEPAEDILIEYLAHHGKELGWLRDLSPQDWNRTGRHPWWGERALQWWVEQILRSSEEQLQRLEKASRA